jgi:pimeloyl-ACP methyl ester carboxylesterase
MDVILIPGLWLDADSWSDVLPTLQAAGLRAHPLTMPGVGAPVAESGDIGIADWVTAVVAEIDRIDGPVVLVGHSGGGNVAWGAADARPDRVAHVVFVDTFPPGDGQSIWEFPVVDGVIPFPGWDFFEDAEVSDLDAATRAARGDTARSVPEKVPADELSLTDLRRRDLPVTMITGTMPEADLREIIAARPAWAEELASLTRLSILERPSGHWPQFSRPVELGRDIVAAIS